MTSQAAQSSNTASTQDEIPLQGFQCWSVPFQHLTQYQVLLCTACEFCVVPSQVQTHLYHHHPTITAKQRQQIEQQVAGTPGLAHTVDAVVFPGPEERPVPGIPLQNGCFRCTQCQWLSSTLKNMQKHCRQVHQWKSGKGKGGSLKNRQAPESSQMWTTGHCCQQLFKTPTWKKWSKVQPISQQVDLTSRATL